MTAMMSLAIGISQLRYKLMRPPWHMQSVVDQKVVTQHMIVFLIHLPVVCPHQTVDYSELLRVGAVFTVTPSTQCLAHGQYSVFGE